MSIFRRLFSFPPYFTAPKPLTPEMITREAARLLRKMMEAM